MERVLCWMSSNGTYLIVGQEKRWLWMRMWRMCSQTLKWFSTLALLQGEPLVLSTPKHTVDMGPQGETQNCSIWSPWGWTPVLPSLCCGPCQHSLPCRPRGHAGDHVCSGWLCSDTAHERLQKLFSLLFIHVVLHRSHVCQFSCN